MRRMASHTLPGSIYAERDEGVGVGAGAGVGGAEETLRPEAATTSGSAAAAVAALAAANNKAYGASMFPQASTTVRMSTSNTETVELMRWSLAFLRDELEDDFQQFSLPLHLLYMRRVSLGLAVIAGLDAISPVSETGRWVSVGFACFTFTVFVASYLRFFPALVHFVNHLLSSLFVLWVAGRCFDHTIHEDGDGDGDGDTLVERAVFVLLCAVWTCGLLCVLPSTNRIPFLGAVFVVLAYSLALFVVLLLDEDLSNGTRVRLVLWYVAFMGPSMVVFPLVNEHLHVMRRKSFYLSRRLLESGNVRVRLNLPGSLSAVADPIRRKLTSMRMSVRGSANVSPLFGRGSGAGEVPISAYNRGGDLRLGATSQMLWQIDSRQLQIDERIGGSGGSWAEVFRGKWKGNDVAIKSLRVRNSEDMLHYVQKEALVLFTVRHPNIVLFRGACTNPERLQLVYEYLARSSVHDLIHNGTYPGLKVDWRLNLRMALGAAHGLRFLHTHSPPIVHMAVKSTNLLVDEDFVVKVADCGLSRLKLEERGQQWVRAPGSMSPEWLRGDQVSIKTDVFSFGVVLWELATHQYLFPEHNAIQVTAGVALRGLRLPLPEDAPSAYVDLLKSIWEEDPAVRPSFDQICDSLASCLDNAEAQPQDSLASGHVEITVMEARDLMSGDYNGFSDPYVIVSLNDSVFRTKVIKKTVNPSWNETFKIELPVVASGALQVKVYDWNMFTQHDFLGECSIPLAELHGSSTTLDKWYKLQPGEANVPVQGSIRVSCSPSPSLLEVFAKMRQETASVLRGWEIPARKVKFVSIIRAGKYGVAYRGLFRGKSVAIKTLFFPKTHKSAAFSKFRADVADICEIPPHPNLVQYFGACTQLPDMFVLAEYIGVSLREQLDEGGLERSERFQVALDVCTGMYYLHCTYPNKAPMYHQDLSSHCVLLDGKKRAKIADYNAWAIRSEQQRTVNVAASPAWASPEVMRGAEPGPKSDVYSFGIVLFEIFTGLEPFSQDLSSVALIDKVLNQGLRPRVPDDMEDTEVTLIMFDCWDSDPLIRPNFEEVLQRLGTTAVEANIEIDVLDAEQHRESAVNPKPVEFEQDDDLSQQRGSLSPSVYSNQSDEDLLRSARRPSKPLTPLSRQQTDTRMLERRSNRHQMSETRLLLKMTKSRSTMSPFAAGGLANDGSSAPSSPTSLDPGRSLSPAGESQQSLLQERRHSLVSRSEPDIRAVPDDPVLAALIEENRQSVAIPRHPSPLANVVSVKGGPAILVQEEGSAREVGGAGGSGDGAVSSKGDEEAAASSKGDGEAAASSKGDGEAAASSKGDGEAAASSKGDGEAAASSKGSGENDGDAAAESKGDTAADQDTETLEA